MTDGYEESLLQRSGREVAYATVISLAEKFGRRARRAERRRSGHPYDDKAAEAAAWERARKETVALANKLLRIL